MRQRRRIFVGCEGSGEHVLATVLQKFADDEAIPVHLDIFNAQGGSPQDILRRSMAEKTRRARVRGDHTGGAFLLLDQDRIDHEGCLDSLLAAARRKNIQLVRQQCSLECFLGRIISGISGIGDHRALVELKRCWPHYSKGFDAAELKAQLTSNVIRNSHYIWHEWRILLERMGFI